jgi:hypothetical protein
MRPSLRSTGALFLRSIVVACLLLVPVAAQATVDVFGPRTYSIPRNQDLTTQETIVLGTACDTPLAVYTLVVTNGLANGTGRAEGEISFNGEKVVSGNDLKNAGTLERVVKGNASNTLKLELKAKATDATLTIALRRHVDLTSPVFAEKAYTLSSAKKGTFNETFAVANLTGPFTLILNNGSASLRPVDDAEIVLNGLSIITKKDIESRGNNDATQVIQKTVTLNAQNTLSIDLKTNKTPAGVTLSIVRHLSDTNGPQVALAAPQDGQHFSAATITVSGRVTDDSGVVSAKLNGSALTLAADGAFSRSVTLIAGPTKLTFDAVDCEGNSKRTEITVFLDAGAPQLAVTVPASGAFLATTTVAVSGTVTDSAGVAGVTVNGQPAAINGSTFSGAATFTGDGAKQIVVIATNSFARQTTVTVPVTIDTTAPAITGSTAPPPNAAGWNSTAPTVAFTCSDATSGIATCPPPVSVTSEGERSISGTATDRAGNNATAAVAVKYDATVPQIAATLSPAPNAAGWTRADTTVTFTCSDTLSGMATCPASIVVPASAGSAPQTRSATAVDRAGNSATASATVKIDAVPPAVMIQFPLPALMMYGSSVELFGVAEDGDSGIASVTCNGAPATITATGYQCTLTLTPGHNPVSVVATDNAGNTAAATQDVEYQVDNGPPTIEPRVSATRNPAGWYNRAVEVSWICDDAISLVLQCGADRSFFADGANQTVTGEAVDSAGNTATASITLSIDTLLPTITPDETSLTAKDAAHITGLVTDEGSGLKSVACDGIAATMTGNRFDCTVPVAGNLQVVRIVATDVADNVREAEVSVTVDRTPPELVIIEPATHVITASRTITISGTVSDDGGGSVTVTVGGIATTVEDSGFTTTAALQAGHDDIAVVATDAVGNFTTQTVAVDVPDRSGIRITSPADFAITGASITVTGSITGPVASIDVNGIAAAISGANFTAANVPVAQGRTVITAAAHMPAGDVVTDHINVYRDAIPPRVSVYSPAAGAVVTGQPIAVTGMVDDIVVGTINAGQMTVSVNGVPAQIANRAFRAANVPLTPGGNTLTVVATDQAGNVTTITHPVTLANTGARIVAVAGDGQSAASGAALPIPLRVRLIDAGGASAAGQAVTFTVVQNDGSLSSGGQSARTVTVMTNGAGESSAGWTLGQRAGAGNNRVQARASGFDGVVDFHADAQPGPPSLLVVDVGSDQFGVIGEVVPRPFVAVAFDAAGNRLADVPVTFTVTAGGGSIEGLASVIVRTDSDGRAWVKPRLGPDEGADGNVIVASMPNGNTPAVFVATGRAPGAVSDTRISGIVLDNTNVPITGVTLRIDQTARSVQTDAQGHFVIDQAPVGYVKLIVDGTTVQRPGTWPMLEYAMYANPGQDNTIGMPIYILPIDVTRGLQVDERTGGTLTIPELPGFSLTVAPGSALFPNGSRAGTISVTLVHSDKMPMSPGLGQEPRFIVTVQPPGVHFDTPAVITFPNTEGLPPGFIAELYSFDHDLGQFVAIGTGAVSEDGTVLRADAGVGLTKGGWNLPYTPPPPPSPPTGTTANLTLDAYVYVPPQEDPTSTTTSTARRSRLRPRSDAAMAAQATATPSDVVAVGACGFVIADGFPGAGAITFQPNPANDPDVVEWGDLTGCPNAAKCTAKFKAKKPGAVTLHVSYSGNGAFAEKDVKVTVFFLAILPTELKFVGTEAVYRDPAIGTKIVPGWKSTNSATQNEPVMIVKNDKMAIHATFSVNNPPTALKGVLFKVKVPNVGTFSGRKDIPAGATSVADVELKGKADDPQFSAYYIANTTFFFKVLPPSECPVELNAGFAFSPVYTTFTKVSFKVYLSTLHIAVAPENAFNVLDSPATNYQEAFNRVWSKFKTQPAPHGPIGYDASRTFRYYGKPFAGTAPAAEEEPLLQDVDGSGRCGAFMPLMGHALALAGVQSQPTIVKTTLTGTPTAGGTPFPAQFLVRNWTPVASLTQPTFSAKPPFVYAFVTFDLATQNSLSPAKAGRRYGDLVNGDGAAGENNSDPKEKIFSNHAIVRVDGKYYDSSYGLEYTNAADFQQQSIAYHAVLMGGSTKPLPLEDENGNQIKDAAGNQVLADFILWKARVPDSSTVPLFDDTTLPAYKPNTPAPAAAPSPPPVPPSAGQEVKP